MDKELTTRQEVETFVKDNTAALIYFYSDNCAPCISLRPKVVQLLEEEYPKMQLSFVNSEKYPAVPAAFGIFANPTLVSYFEGDEYRRESKYVSIPQLSQLIARPYNMIFD